jgi:hypothetical protein
MVEVKQLRHNDVLWRHLQDQWQTAKYKLPESMSAVYIIETLGFIHSVTNRKASLCSDVLSGCYTQYFIEQVSSTAYSGIYKSCRQKKLIRN